MRRKRGDRRHENCLNLAVGEVDLNELKRRDTEFLMAFFAFILLATGGLLALATMQTAAHGRWLSDTAIVSASALRGAGPGRPVVLSGRIDPQIPVSAWDLAIYYGERLEKTKRTSRYGTSSGPSEWFRYGPAHRPPFTLVTDDGQLPINGIYAIEEPSIAREVGRLRYSGFRPGDGVVVIGTTVKGGLSVSTVYGGGLAKYWKTAEALPDRIVRLRWVGLAVMGIGLLLSVVWATRRIWRRAEGQTMQRSG
jgi:hypothetical protein